MFSLKKVLCNKICWINILRKKISPDKNLGQLERKLEKNYSSKFPYKEQSEIFFYIDFNQYKNFLDNYIHEKFFREFSNSVENSIPPKFF